MNIKDYEYVVELARQGNISRAAEALYITQSALSKYLQRLEQTLSVSLFYRVGNRYRPTAAGELYLRKARQILDLDQELSTEIAQFSSSRDAAIRFGYPMGMFSFVMERLFPEFFQLCPTARISTEENSSQILIQQVEDGKLDLCLAYAKEKKATLQYERLAKVWTVLAVPAGSKLLALAEKDPAYPYSVLKSDCWLQEPYIHLASHTRSGQRASIYFQKLGKLPPVRLYVDDTRSALAAVEQGFGNCLITELPHTDRLVNYLILPNFTEPFQEVYAVLRKNEGESASYQELVRLAKELYGKT